jgi:branched-chain amino acid transport system permease protein
MSATRRSLLLFTALAVAAFTLPAFVSDFHALEFGYVGIYLVALTGLNVLTGYTGQISLGHGAFMAIGGYTTAILMTDHGVRDIATIPLAILVAGAAGVLFGLPAARLSGLYLALATFAIAAAMPAAITKFDGFTGGNSGVGLFGTPELTATPDPLHLLGFELNFDNWLYYLSWAVALIGYVTAWLILRGRTGRAFRAVRDSETAAVSAGISLTRTKVLAFGISAAYAGAAGALFAIATRFVSPDAFPVALSIFLLVGVVVSGLGSLTGLLAGAVFIQFLPQWSQTVSKSPGAPAVVYGVALILVVLALPGGVSGFVERALAFFRRGRHFP